MCVDKNRRELRICSGNLGTHHIVVACATLRPHVGAQYQLLSSCKTRTKSGSNPIRERKSKWHILAAGSVPGSELQRAEQVRIVRRARCPVVDNSGSFALPYGLLCNQRKIAADKNERAFYVLAFIVLGTCSFSHIHDRRRDI